MNMKSLLSTVICVLAISGCKSTKHENYVRYDSVKQVVEISPQTIDIALNSNQNVPFRGEYVNGDQINGVNILYQGGLGAVGLVAQLATHSALNSSARNAALTEKKRLANQVLNPLSLTLRQFTMQDITEQISTYRFTETTSEPQTSLATNDYVLTSSPVFFLSQDTKQITLKHSVTITNTSSKAIVYENLIEVLAPTITDEKPIEILKANEGAILKEMSSELYQYSLDLVIADVTGQYQNPAHKQKSYKLVNDGKERFERGTMVQQNDDRIVIRNLRGWLIAFYRDQQAAS